MIFTHFVERYALELSVIFPSVKKHKTTFPKWLYVCLFRGWVDVVVSVPLLHRLWSREVCAGDFMGALRNSTPFERWRAHHGQGRGWAEMQVSSWSYGSCVAGVALLRCPGPSSSTVTKHKIWATMGGRVWPWWGGCHQLWKMLRERLSAPFQHEEWDLDSTPLYLLQGGKGDLLPIFVLLLKREMDFL